MVLQAAADAHAASAVELREAVAHAQQQAAAAEQQRVAKTEAGWGARLAAVEAEWRGGLAAAEAEWAGRLAAAEARHEVEGCVERTAAAAVAEVLEDGWSGRLEAEINDWSGRLQVAAADQAAAEERHRLELEAVADELEVAVAEHRAEVVTLRSAHELQAANREANAMAALQGDFPSPPRLPRSLYNS